jgi:hypothetical protein
MEPIHELRRSNAVVPQGFIRGSETPAGGSLGETVRRRFYTGRSLAGAAAAPSSPTITQLKCQLALAAKKIKDLESELARLRAENVRGK